MGVKREKGTKTLHSVIDFRSGQREGEQQMDDERLTDLLIELADAIKDCPESRERDSLVDRFFALISHLESTGAISRSTWNLKSQRG